MKFALKLALAAVAVALASGAQAQTLKTVKARGVLNCGIGTGLAGFGLADASGTWRGVNIEFCHSLAAAIFSDPAKVKFVSLSSKDRFTALQAGESDVVAATTTWTMSRDVQVGLNFRAVFYYDGQGFMVKKSTGIKSAKELSGASICIQQGTTTELNTADYFRKNNMKFEPVTFATNNEATEAYEAGRCDAFTTDQSGLYSERLRFKDPSEHVVLPETISKEPLGYAVRHGDDQWFDIVSWAQYALVTAEELGVTQANIDEMREKSDNPDVRRLLGKEGSFGQSLGLENDWAYRIIKTAGNYGEIFERNLGQQSKLKIARGQNALWMNGGLQYAPPIR
ncbi:amino acid ABC transporter substrate-binding protein [Bosea sp. F3-2]|uniref:amino acid ABC transporter substrate-binding protein n=1 Tax=Bosea sp. F3-2 TaxID=2599640 RepID=UPI0011EEF2D2|nr:amino acid ABC transporter substrate-binding protein [Bosea sp. F3-2]QEL24096.1 amino acid ABC transporter substrate-binding protein [Bosea sp. F3-2]